MTKRLQANGARIELMVNVVDVVSEQERKYTDDQIKAFEILQRKAEQGYKDVDSFIKTRVINSAPINIVILIGKTGIIDSDIKHQMKEATLNLLSDLIEDKLDIIVEKTYPITSVKAAYNEVAK